MRGINSVPRFKTRFGFRTGLGLLLSQAQADSDRNMQPEPHSNTHVLHLCGDFNKIPYE